MNQLSASIAIGATMLQQYAVGDTIEARFAEVIKPRHLDEGCFMTTIEDEQFRAAVGGLLLSYGAGSPEFERITIEMQQIQRLSTLITASQLGMMAELPDPPEDFKPIGLLGLWHSRDRR